MADYLGRQLGNYRLTQLLGQGGFAEVYLAEHLHLKTLAAVKLLYGRLTAQDIEVFTNEARTLAALKHPHILHVLDFGFAQALPFLVMEYAPGGTLRDRHPPGTRVPLTKIVSYVNQIASALTYAHAQKLIHRDIKPENMLIDADGTLLLGDFGIVATAHSTASMKTIDNTGTVHYMAPEQIKGKPRPQSDQYALAIVIYEWLSGERPFRGSSPIEIAMHHLSDPPPSLCQRIPSLPIAIEHTIFKALAKDPNLRFPDVLTFAQELEQISQQTRIPPVIQKPIHKENAPSVPHRQQALAPAQLVSTRLPFSQTLQPQRTRDAVRGATLFVYEHNEGPVRSMAWSPRGYFLASAGNDRMIRIWEEKTGEIKHILHGNRETLGDVDIVIWSPDGKHLVSAGEDKLVHIWDVATGKEVLRYTNHTHPQIKAVAWSPDGKRLASADADRMIHIWEAASGKELFRYQGHTDTIRSVAWSPDGQYLASAGDDKLVHIWKRNFWQSSNWKSSQEYIEYTYTGHTGSVDAVAWSPDGKCLASVSSKIRDSSVHIWEANSGKRVKYYQGSYPSVVAWSPDGRLLAYGGSKVQIREVVSGTALLFDNAPPDKSLHTQSISWSPDGQSLAVANSMVHIWDTISGNLRQSYKDHTAIIKAVAWSPSGHFLVSAGDDKTISIREATSGKELFRYHGHTNTIEAVAWSPDGKRLASAGDYKMIRIWDVATGKEVLQYKNHTGITCRVVWSPDGRHLASGGIDGTVHIWEAASGKELSRYQGHTDTIRVVAWAPDGKRLASGGSDRMIHIWEAASGKELSRYQGHTDTIRSVAWSPDGHTLAFISGIKVNILEVASNKLLSQYEGRITVVWSPDGHYLASINPDGDGQIICIHESSGELYFTYRGHSGRVNTLAWSPDGKQIISGGYEVHVWQARE